MVGSLMIREKFSGYPYDDVDAGYAEMEEGKTKYLLFKRNMFWTFEVIII